jgi:radical SAM protein with 4Fe4S-binding SPASM domain
VKRIIDFMNICIVTNRGCNLRCSHCYVEAELLASKFKMTEANYQLAYTRIEELLLVDKHVKRVNVEVLGGEISRMPFEFWERQLPFSLAKQAHFKELTGHSAAFAWCTNMVIQDPRYFDLLNQHGHEPNWEIFIPWELDTNRFGKNDKLYPTYLKNVNKLDKAKKAINIIPTKHMLSLGMDEIKSFIKTNGFSDLSCDMLYPYGSGKAYFDLNQPAFHEVSQFYIDLTEALIDEDWITISPWDEVSGCLQTGKGFNLNGNDAYDMTIEPDGSVVLNSSMTGSEAPLPSQALLLDARNWALKAFFENIRQMDVKYSSEFEQCRQCEYLRYCNGGYYHYKYLPQEQIALYDAQDCAGYKKYWDYAKAKLGDRVASVSKLNHEAIRAQLRAQRELEPAVLPGVSYRESALSSDYEAYFDAINAMVPGSDIFLDKARLFGSSISERLWFYDGLGLSPRIELRIAQMLDQTSLRNIARNMMGRNYKSVQTDPELVWDLIRRFPQDWVALNVLEAIGVIQGGHSVDTKDTKATVGRTGLVIDEQSDELFRFVLNYPAPEDIMALTHTVKPDQLSIRSDKFLERLNQYLHFEQVLIARSAV